MTEFRYSAIRVIQQPESQAMYLLTAEASNLLKWADVPNARGDYMAGYQRVYDPGRAQDIKGFLEADPKNIVPGAIIVTAAADHVEISETDIPGVVTVTIHSDERSSEERLRDLLDSFKARLSPAELGSLPEVSKSDTPSIDEDDQALAAEGASESADGDSFSDDGPGIPDSYLATLTAELAEAVADFESLSEERRDAITNYVDSVSKPGLIIDGQHRVFGAKDVSKNEVLLPLVLLPGLPMAEQVFHFYVLNNKAKPLAPAELRRTISTSLTNSEIDALWQRFEAAGVDPEAARWTFKINSEAQSPFNNLVDFGLGAEGFIKENVAYQVVSKFMSMGRKYKSLYKEIPAWNPPSDERLTYFYSFWQGIRDRYSDAWEAAVANGGGQMFYKVTLLAVQEYVLDFLAQMMNVRRVENKPSPMQDLDDLQGLVKASLADLPPEFFTAEWQVKQIDTTDGRKFLREQMDICIRNQGQHRGNQALFRKT